jgi:hypothetical protein
MTTIANSSVSTLNTALKTTSTQSADKTVETASTSSSGAVGSSQNNPFVMTDDMKWLPWKVSNAPQYISYKGNIYKLNAKKSDHQLQYISPKQLPKDKNQLWIWFTGKSRTDITGYKTERVQVGTRKEQIGTERVQVGTERVQTGTERVQVGTERVQTGTERVKVGERVVRIDHKKEQVSLNLSREIDGKNATGAIGDMLTRGTTQLSDANQFFNNSRFASYKTGSLTGEDNQVTSGTVDPLTQRLGADDMYVAGDPHVGGKGNNYAQVDVTPQTGYMTMYEDGSDTGRKTTINSNPAVINTQGNKAFTEYGFVVQDDAGAKTTAKLSGGKLVITGPDGQSKTLLPGETYVVGNASDPAAKFYYADMPGGENGTTEKRLVFESYEKPTAAVVNKLVETGMSRSEATAIRNKMQASFGFRVPDGQGSFRMASGVGSGNALNVTSNGVKTYYDAHFYKPPERNLSIEKCIEVPIKEPIYENRPIYTEKPKYEERPVYTEKPKYEERPVYKEVPVYENKKTPIYGKTYEIEKELTSPLVLDLDGNGIQTTAPDRTIDVDGDGTLDRVSWFGSGDGVLAFDANKNGKIDMNGTELFGDNSDIDGDGKPDGDANGFDALKRFAAKHLGNAAVADNKLDAAEIRALENKAGLRIITSGNRTQTLSSLGVTGIGLNYATANEVDAYGNQTLQQGSFQRKLSNGKTVSRDIADVWLLKHDADEASILPLPPEPVASEPEPVVETPSAPVEETPSAPVAEAPGTPAEPAPAAPAPQPAPAPAAPPVSDSLSELLKWLQQFLARFQG